MQAPPQRCFVLFNFIWEMVRNMQRGGGMEYLKVRERREKRHFDDALVAVVTIVSEFCILLFEICFVPRQPLLFILLLRVFFGVG